MDTSLLVNIKFNILLTVQRDISYNKNQQDALITFNLFQ